MRSVNRLPKVLFFINGMVPTETEAEEASNLKASVAFRNASLVDPVGNEALEECDGVMGAVPDRYKRAFGGSFDDVSGIGALRMVHGGEPGVTDSQALHLDSRSTGDFVEEDRRRAYRGPAINEEGARPLWPNRNSVPTRPDGSEPAGGVKASPTFDPAAPIGIAGAAHVRPEQLPGWGDSGGAQTAPTLEGWGTGPGAGGSGLRGAPSPFQAAGSGGGDNGDGENLSRMSRADLETLATTEGVENANDLPNKDALIAAINEKRNANA